MNSQLSSRIPTWMRIFCFLLVFSRFAFAASFEFINDFEAYDQGNWEGASYRNIMIDDLDTVTIFFQQALPHPQFNQNFQILFRRFDKLGHPVSVPTFVSDSSLYQTRGNMHVGCNRKGKWVNCAQVRYNCTNWPFCPEEIRAWVSGEGGNSVMADMAIGSELSFPWRNLNPVSALDSNGNFVVAWWRSATSDSLADVWCQLFDVHGLPRSSLIQVTDNILPDGSMLDDSRAPRVDMTPDGDFVIVWQVRCDGPSCQPSEWDPFVMMRLFDANGNPKTEEVCVSDFRQDWPIPCYYPDVAIADNGNFAVAWTRLLEPCASENRVLICLKRFFADGTAMGPEQVIDSIHCSTGNTPTVSLSSDSAFNLLLAWENNNAPTYTVYANLMAQRINQSGQLVGTRYRINDISNNMPMHASHATLNNNGLAGFYWSDLDSGHISPTRDLIQLMDYEQIGYYVPGDADNNSRITISDPVYLVNYIFTGGPAPASNCLGDSDGNLIINISDAVILINYIFASGSIPGGCL